VCGHLVGALSVVLLLACSGDRNDSRVRADDIFSCYRTAPQGGEWRECSPGRSTPEDCARGGGCFERAEAHCFRYLLGVDEPATLCTPTADECEGWHAQRSQGDRPGHALSGCAVARPDEYIRVH
jgi:hypothetical protein